MAFFYSLFVLIHLPLNKTFFLKNYLKIVFFLLISFSSTAQNLTHEIGVFAGTATIQTDYGQRNNFLSSYGNSSLSFSVIHYLHFFNKNTQWNSQEDLLNHFMVKTELNYMAEESFKNYGEYTEGDSPSAIRLRNMIGTISMVNFGFQLEYYYKELKEFMYPYSEIKWNPYLSLGFKYSSYYNTLKSNLGDWRADITILPIKYRTPGHLAVGSGGAFSFVLGAGTRYKLNEKFDLAANFNWQFFFSDAVDGLQANVPENKNNEWLIHFQLGIIYHLNFGKGIF